MKILIAEDDAASRLMLQSLLTKWGYEVVAACDGNEAMRLLSEPGHPHLVVLDWMMPGLEGPQIVRQLRARESVKQYYYAIIITALASNTAANALNSGADDFINNPFDHDELRARVAVGVRVVELQTSLADHVEHLTQSLARIKRLEGIVPICMYCKRIRDDKDSWSQMERYISDHSEAQFSHGICPECYKQELWNK